MNLTTLVLILVNRIIALEREINSLQDKHEKEKSR